MASGRDVGRRRSAVRECKADPAGDLRFAPATGFGPCAGTPCRNPPSRPATGGRPLLIDVGVEDRPARLEDDAGGRAEGLPRVVRGDVDKGVPPPRGLALDEEAVPRHEVVGAAAGVLVAREGGGAAVHRRPLVQHGLRPGAAFGPKSALSAAGFGPGSTYFTQFRARLHRVRPSSGKCCPTSTKFGPNSAELGPNSSKVGQTPAEFGQASTKLV